MSVANAFYGYSEFLKHISANNLDELKNYVHDDVVFSDPFHDEKGIDSMTRIFNKMLHLVANLKFEVGDYAINNNTVYFEWELTGFLSKKEWVVNGVTILKFNSELKVIEHIEHWDAASQFYERFPFIGWLMRYFRYRVSR